MESFNQYINQKSTVNSEAQNEARKQNSQTSTGKQIGRQAESLSNLEEHQKSQDNVKKKFLKQGSHRAFKVQKFFTFEGSMVRSIQDSSVLGDNSDKQSILVNQGIDFQQVHNTLYSLESRQMKPGQSIQEMFRGKDWSSLSNLKIQRNSCEELRKSIEEYIVESSYPISMRHGQTILQKSQNKSHFLYLASNGRALSRIQEVSEQSELKSEKVSGAQLAGSKSPISPNIAKQLYQEDMMKIKKQCEMEMERFSHQTGTEMKQLMDQNREKNQQIVVMDRKIQTKTNGKLQFLPGKPGNSYQKDSGTVEEYIDYQKMEKSAKTVQSRVEEAVNDQNSSPINKVSRESFFGGQNALQLSKSYSKLSRSRNDTKIQDRQESCESRVTYAQSSRLRDSKQVFDLKEHCINLQIENCKLLQKISQISEQSQEKEVDLQQKRNELVKKRSEYQARISQLAQNFPVQDSSQQLDKQLKSFMVLEHDLLKTQYEELEKTEKELQARLEQVQKENKQLKDQTTEYLKMQQAIQKSEKEVDTLLKLKTILELKITSKTVENCELKKELQAKNIAYSQKLQEVTMSTIAFCQKQINFAKNKYERTLQDCISVFRENQQRFKQQVNRLRQQIQNLNQKIKQRENREQQLIKGMRQKQDIILNLEKKLEMPRFMRERNQERQRKPNKNLASLLSVDHSQNSLLTQNLKSCLWQSRNKAFSNSTDNFFIRGMSKERTQSNLRLDLDSKRNSKEPTYRQQQRGYQRKESMSKFNGPCAPQVQNCTIQSQCSSASMYINQPSFHRTNQQSGIGFTGSSNPNGHRYQNQQSRNLFTDRGMYK